MIIQQKRNNVIHENLVAAKKYLNEYVTTNKATIKDGEILFTRYYGGMVGQTGMLRSYTLRGIVNATSPSKPYVEFDDVNNDNIVRENLLYYSNDSVGSDGCLKPCNLFDPKIIRGSQIKTDRIFTFSFELLPAYYSSTSDNMQVYFKVRNDTRKKYIPITLLDKGDNYITQDSASRILFTIKESECKTKKRLSITFQIHNLWYFASYDDVLIFEMDIQGIMKHMRNPKLELGSEMTDYCENALMVYDKNVKVLLTPKYDNNNIEVNFIITRLVGIYKDVFKNSYKNFNVLSVTNDEKVIVNINAVDTEAITPTPATYYVITALKVKGYNEEKLYLNGYGVDVIYITFVKGRNHITAIQTNKSKQYVLKKYRESGEYSYYKIADKNIGDAPITCIPVDVLYNTNATPRPFMTDSFGKTMYPKIGKHQYNTPMDIYFTHGIIPITPPNIE